MSSAAVEAGTASRRCASASARARRRCSSVADPLVEDYLLLGLRLGRHVDGLVDAYYGPPELKDRVDSETLTEAAVLVEQGDVLLEALGDGWLRDQARGLRTY